MDRQLLYFMLRGFRLPFHSCDITVNFVERFVHFVIWKKSFTVAPARIVKISPSFCFLEKAIYFTRFITIVGVGTSVNFPQVIFLTELSEKKL